MDKKLLAMDINLKVIRLHYDLWYSFYLKLILSLAIMEVVDFILGLILEIGFNISNAVKLCATIPNLFICIILLIFSYMFKKRYIKMQKLKKDINQELNLLADYDNLEEKYIYEEFQKINEIKLPKLYESDT